MSKAIITVVGMDTVGIIARVCTYPVSYTHLISEAAGTVMKNWIFIIW